MLKFKGRFEERSRWKDGFGTYDIDIPTVDEVYETIAPMTADTVLQILHGQGIYWGYEIKHDFDNEIREIKDNGIRAYSEYSRETSRQRARKYRLEHKAQIEANKKARIEAKQEAKRERKLRDWLTSYYRELHIAERKAVRFIAQCNKCTILEATIKYIDANKVIERKRINDYVLGAR